MSAHAANPRPLRLAQRDALAVDLCPCGMPAVHRGALSLRLDLESISELIDVLNEAVAKHDAVLAGAAHLAALGRPRRGKA